MFFEIMQDFVIMISMKSILSSVGTKLSLLLCDRNIWNDYHLYLKVSLVVQALNEILLQDIILFSILIYISCVVVCSALISILASTVSNKYTH